MSGDQPPERGHDADFVQSFARGLAVIKSFGAETPAQSLADVARATKLSRATVRRLLLTLERLGYATSVDGRFRLTPRLLDLGYAHLSSLDFASIATSYLEELRGKLNESSSVSVLDDTDVIYVARVPAKRIMTVSIGLGSRFPAFQTSMGRVLLAELDDDDIVDRFERSDRSYSTPSTVDSSVELLRRIEEVRAQGWALVDQELELGVRSVAAPLRDKSGVIAAVNVSTHVSRTEVEELLGRFLPALLEAAAAINHALEKR
ncbi:MAG: IclR family transcriptional regulator domain-containing protein [Acidimicrobiia bacterium]